MQVKKITKEDWTKLSALAHKAVFQEIMPEGRERIDFALILEKENGEIMGYGTFQERDADSLYWQYGGAFLGTKSSSMTFPGYLVMLKWCKEHYKRVTTLVENTNLVMLKFALSAGLMIIGVRMYNGKVLVELGKEFS
jgi:hypothetical protein